jgi:hypothetical protein
LPPYRPGQTPRMLPPQSAQPASGPKRCLSEVGCQSPPLGGPRSIEATRANERLGGQDVVPDGEGRRAGRCLGTRLYVPPRRHRTRICPASVSLAAGRGCHETSARRAAQRLVFRINLTELLSPLVRFPAVYVT